MSLGIVNYTVKDFKGEPVGNGYFDACACIAISLKILYGLNDNKSQDQGIHSLDQETKQSVLNAVKNRIEDMDEDDQEDLNKQYLILE